MEGRLSGRLKGWKVEVDRVEGWKVGKLEGGRLIEWKVGELDEGGRSIGWKGRRLVGRFEGQKGSVY